MIRAMICQGELGIGVNDASVILSRRSGWKIHSADRSLINSVCRLQIEGVMIV